MNITKVGININKSIWVANYLLIFFDLIFSLVVTKFFDVNPYVQMGIRLFIDFAIFMILLRIFNKNLNKLKAPYPYRRETPQPIFRKKVDDYPQQINRQLHQISDLKKKVDAYEVSNSALKQYIRNLEAEQGKRVRKTKKVYEVGVTVKANRGKEITLPPESDEPKKYKGSSSKKIDFL